MTRLRYQLPPEPTCTCDDPLLDGDVGLSAGDNDYCWRCRRPLPEEDEDE